MSGQAREFDAVPQVQLAAKPGKFAAQRAVPGYLELKFQSGGAQPGHCVQQYVEPFFLTQTRDRNQPHRRRSRAGPGPDRVQQRAHRYAGESRSTGQVTTGRGSSAHSPSRTPRRRPRPGTAPRMGAIRTAPIRKQRCARCKRPVFRARHTRPQPHCLIREPCTCTTSGGSRLAWRSKALRNNRASTLGPMARERSPPVSDMAFGEGKRRCHQQMGARGRCGATNRIPACRNSLRYWLFRGTGISLKTVTFKPRSCSAFASSVICRSVPPRS